MREIGKRLYFRNPSSNTVSSASKVGATTSTGSYVRYGTAQADSAEGKVQVKLDNSEDVVTCSCDSPIKQGDRVKVIVTESGALIAMPIGQNIVDYVDEVKVDLSQEIVNKGNEILDEVNGEMNAWKEDHQLTDADITHQIQQSISQTTETWEGQLSDLENGIKTDYALKTEVTQGINGLRSEISETYATSEGVQNQIDTSIEQASGQIQSTVEQNVMDSVGNTYATKTELTQTSNELNLTITGAVNTANDAKETADEVSTYFTADATGLKIGQTGNSIAIKCASSGSFQVLRNSSVIAQFGTYTDMYGVEFMNGNGSITRLGYGGVNTSGWSSRSISVQDLVTFMNNGDYLIDAGSNGTIRYWEWANGRKECSGTMSLTMSAGGSAGARSVSLPLRYKDGHSYRVLLSMNNNSSSPPDFYNNVQLIAYNMSANRFYLSGWNTGSESVAVTVGWYVIGV